MINYYKTIKPMINNSQQDLKIWNVGYFSYVCTHPLLKVSLSLVSPFLAVCNDYHPAFSGNLLDVITPSLLRSAFTSCALSCPSCCYFVCSLLNSQSGNMTSHFDFKWARRLLTSVNLVLLVILSFKTPSRKLTPSITISIDSCVTWGAQIVLNVTLVECTTTTLFFLSLWEC